MSTSSTTVEVGSPAIVLQKVGGEIVQPAAQNKNNDKPETQREDTGVTALMDDDGDDMSFSSAVEDLPSNTNTTTTCTTMEENTSTAEQQQPPPAEAGKRMLLSDEEALAKAKEHMKNDQVLAAARLLKQLGASNKIPQDEQAFQKEVEKKSALIEHVIEDLLANPEAPHQNDGDNGEAAAMEDSNNNTDQHHEWIKMGESHNDHRDTVMYYQITDDLQLKCRLETPIESSLLVPLLSVLIETELYTSWLPKWNIPRIGLETVEKLAQMGRTEQIIQFISAVPWPFPSRDVILHTCACDDIDDIEGDDNTTGTIAIGLVSLEEGTEVRKSTVCNPHYSNGKDDALVIPPSPEGMKRAEFDGGLLIRKCPHDHVSLQNSTIDYPPDQHLILVGFSMRVDGKISPMFPKTIINFVIQTAITQMWAMFLTMAEEIKAGTRPQHAQAIAAKREEIYDWVDKRIEDMFAHLQQQQQISTSEKTDEMMAASKTTKNGEEEKGGDGGNDRDEKKEETVVN